MIDFNGMLFAALSIKSQMNTTTPTTDIKIESATTAQDIFSASHIN